MKYYLAYGSNLNLEQMEYRCPGAKVIGKTFIDGYRLMFKGSKTGSYLTIEKDEGSRVPVGVWELNEAHEKALDRYEGYPTFYYKKELKVEVDGKVIEAIVYIMHEDHKLGIPTRYYYETCIEGYKAFSFDEAYLEEAYDYSLGGLIHGDFN